MCGISGFFNLADRSGASDLLASMAASLRHRGPDAQGTWLSSDQSAGLATTRLSVIDLAGGKQPMLSDDGRMILVFNGEIYNFRSLRRELEDLGHRFHTASDTEVVLEAYREWGRSCLARFRGMFAFAVYDVETRTLFLARDRVGIKPLYHASTPHGFYFGSELKAILTSSRISRQLNYSALADYFILGYPLLPRTFFSGVSELEPGSWLTVSPDGRDQGRWWRWEPSPAEWDEPAALEHVERALIASVEEHLVADVPIGAFLSGGIDSSLLAAIMVRELGKQIDTFNVAFPGSHSDESPYARSVAQHLGTKHHELVVEADSSDLSLVDDVMGHFDQPFADSSAIPTYLICREIRRAVKVAIAGDGGDEMFGGYEKFRYADYLQQAGIFPRWCFTGARRLSHGIKGVAPHLYRKGQRFLRAAQSHGEERLIALNCYTFPGDLKDRLQPPIVQALASSSSALSSTLAPEGSRERSSFVNPGGAELIDWTIRFELPGDYLRKVDMMSSAHGLEVRVPLLGEPVLSCAANLPLAMKYSRRTTKLLLRKLASRYLPAQIIEKPKAGFGIPLDTWLGPQGRREVQALLTSSKARLREVVRPDFLEPLLAGFVSQTWNHASMSRFMMYQQVYLLWSLERWLTRWNPSL